jgi:hypothetical protein
VTYCGFLNLAPLSTGLMSARTVDDSGCRLDLEQWPADALGLGKETAKTGNMALRQKKQEPSPGYGPPLTFSELACADGVVRILSAI